MLRVYIWILSHVFRGQKQQITSYLSTPRTFSRVKNCTLWTNMLIIGVTLPVPLPLTWVKFGKIRMWKIFTTNVHKCYIKTHVKRILIFSKIANQQWKYYGSLINFYYFLDMGMRESGLLVKKYKIPKSCPWKRVLTQWTFLSMYTRNNLNPSSWKKYKFTTVKSKKYHSKTIFRSWFR